MTAPAIIAKPGVVHETIVIERTYKASPARVFAAGVSVELFGRTVASRAEKRPASERRDVQMVFQSPDRTLNPRHRIGRIISRPLRRLAGLGRRDAKNRVAELLRSVRLADTPVEQKPRSLSGGQRQRAAIARAFAGAPKVVVLDEPTSARNRMSSAGPQRAISLPPTRKSCAS